MEEQKKKGMDLRVFYFRAKERGLPDVNASYLDIRLNYSNWQRPFFYLKERNIVLDFFDIYKNKEFDILHAHTLFSNGYIALEAKKRWGNPYIVAVRDVDVNVFFKYRIYLRKLGIEILNEAEKIIYISDSYLELMNSKYIPKTLRGEFLKKSVVIPNGVNPYYLNNKYFRNNIENKTLNILTVGFVNKRKNQLAVSEAVIALNKKGIKTKYTIIGKVLDKRIFDKIKKNPYVNYVPFLPKEELIKEYRQADIYVMPSITETFGLTYVEAMSQGLPIIYSKGQGFDNQFSEGVVGYHVESRNVDEIIDRVLDIRSNYEKISYNCSTLSSKFNWEDISKQYINLYKEVLKEV